MRRHVFLNGWLTHYVNWTYHGEQYVDHLDAIPSSVSTPNVEHDIHNLVCSTMGRHEHIIPDEYDPVGNDDILDDCVFDDQYDDTFVQHLQEAEEPLWSGCTEFSKLSFILELYQCKCINQ